MTKEPNLLGTITYLVDDEELIAPLPVTWDAEEGVLVRPDGVQDDDERDRPSRSDSSAPSPGPPGE